MEKQGGFVAGRCRMPAPTWPGALRPHHHVKVLAAAPRVSPSTWLRRLRAGAGRLAGAAALAALRVVGATLTLWLLTTPVNLEDGGQ